MSGSVVEHDPGMSCYLGVTSVKFASSIKPYSCHLCCGFSVHQHGALTHTSRHVHCFFMVKHSNVPLPRRSAQHILNTRSTPSCSQTRICAFQTLPLKDPDPSSLCTHVFLIVALASLLETHMHTRPRHTVHVVHNGHQRQKTCKHLHSGKDQQRLRPKSSLMNLPSNPSIRNRGRMTYIRRTAESDKGS
jgi:hypothetical protein